MGNFMGDNNPFFLENGLFFTTTDSLSFFQLQNHI